MENVLGKITKITTPLQRHGQDEILTEWQIGDINHRLDVRFILDAPTINSITSALEKSNCGMVCLGGLTWRVQVRKGKNGHNYGVVKLNTHTPRPMNTSLTT